MSCGQKARANTFVHCECLTQMRATFFFRWFSEAKFPADLALSLFNCLMHMLLRCALLVPIAELALVFSRKHGEDSSVKTLGLLLHKLDT